MDSHLQHLVCGHWLTLKPVSLTQVVRAKITLWHICGLQKCSCSSWIITRSIPRNGNWVLTPK